MVDTTPLEGLDPYDLFDAEAARIEAFFAGLADDDPAWSRPSRCAGWTVRDVAAHLAATEEYHHACLDGRVQEYFSAMAEQGISGLHEFNQAGVDARSHLPPSAVVAEWRAADAETRRRMRERDGGEMDSSVGAYPVRLQAFHLATELAIHADDMGVPVRAEEAGPRTEWRERVSRFIVSEHHPELSVEPAPDGTRVHGDGVDFTIEGPTFVEAVAARLPPGAIADDAARVLSATP